jgi:hypothetical protein
MKAHEFVNTVVINKPVSETFRFVCDVSKMQKWLRPTNVFAVFPFETKKLTDGPFGEGTLFWVDRMGLRVSRFEADHSFETDSFYFRFPASAVFERTHAVLRFEPVEQGTRFTFTRSVKARPFVKLFERRWTRMLQDQLQAALEKLKSEVER